MNCDALRSGGRRGTPGGQGAAVGLEVRRDINWPDAEPNL